MDNSTIAIELDSVVKTFRNEDNDVTNALQSISANIKRGVITGIVGSDGAGKTTLMRLMAGLLALTEGRISIEGIDPITETARLRDILGYMPQKFGLYEDLTVIENLILYADLQGIVGQERETAFEKLLDFTDLKSFTARRAGNLSGGMKQKLGLACALIGKPKVLLLDEPTVGVDPISRRELWKMVNTLVAEGMTVIWSTTYLSEAELCDEVLVINQGKLIYNGIPQNLTDTMNGRSLQLQGIEGNKHLILKKVLQAPEVIDSVIQGSYVRVVLKDKTKYPDITLLDAGPNAKFVTVKPRFEDAFIDLLGGVPEESISLSKLDPIQIKTQSDIVIEANQLTKKFDSFVAVDHINFKVKRGEIFCLLGPNGAGKSTTFKMMCGLLMPTSGSSTILGIDPKKNPDRARQQLGYMAQKFSLYGDLTVQQNLSFFSGIYGLSGKKQTQTIKQMLDIFDLNPYLNQKSKELPLGFKQRLALACAIMHRPAILFLDEPTSGVDPIARREFWGHINELVESGMTVVITTHFMDEAEYCDDIGLIYRGKVIAAGSPDQLKQRIVSDALPNPTMEDAFINLIEQHDKDTLSVDAKSEKSFSANTPSILQQIERSHFITQHKSLRCLIALCKKEFYQIIRDPSNVFVAFILPLILLFIYGFGINLDTAKLKLGVVMNDYSSEARRFEKSYADSPYIDAKILDLSKAKAELTAGDIRGFVMIQSDFSKKLKQQNGVAPVQVFTDGSEPNTANFVIGYATGAWQTWLNIRAIETAHPLFTPIHVEDRYWYNPAAISRHFLVPGSIVMVMTVIGALLTSLVVAREWERGTMEALLSTPITRMEFILSKLIPYYLLGIIAMLVSTVAAVTVLDTPFRGSLFLLFIETSLFLGSILGLGLLLSTLLRNQFNAAQAALNIAYLPAALLSGFVFEISSMPAPIQAVTYLFPARYFISCLQTLFLAGNVGLLLIENALFLLVAALIFLSLTYKFTRKRLD